MGSSGRVTLSARLARSPYSRPPWIVCAIRRAGCRPHSPRPLSASLDGLCDATRWSVGLTRSGRVDPFGAWLGFRLARGAYPRPPWSVYAMRRAACRPHPLARRRALRAFARLCLARLAHSSILLIWRGSNASATALASPQSIPSCCSNLTSRLKRSSVAAA